MVCDARGRGSRKPRQQIRNSVEGDGLFFRMARYGRVAQDQRISNPEDDGIYSPIVVSPCR